MRSLFLVAALAAAIGSPLAAQRLGKPMDRPRLRDVTDTNDAQAYFNEGLNRFEQEPEVAAAAFYWAARINPAWGEPLYAHRAARIMNDAGLRRELFGNARRSSGEMRRLDSLQFRALLLSPFLYRRLDRAMITGMIREEVGRESRLRGHGEPDRALLTFEIDRYLRSGGPLSRARMAYSRGDFDTALGAYADAMGSSKDRAELRLERGRIFGMRGQVDSAVAEFNLAIEELRKRDEKDLVVFYDSKALAYYSIGVLKDGAADAAGAREAYGQALTEDLSYYPAHIRLGLLALGQNDTTTATSEIALAAQIATDDPQVRYLHGWVLATAQRYAEAATELTKAVELEPYYALPRLRLGQVYEQLNKGPEALAAYQAFLDRAGQQDIQRPYATERIEEVKAILAIVPTAKP